MVVDRGVHPILGQNADRLAQHVAVFAGIDPQLRQIGTSETGHLKSHQCYVIHEQQVSRNEFAQLWQAIDGLLVNYHADLDSLTEAFQVKYAEQGLVKCSLGLDDVVVPSRVVGIQRDTDHEVRVMYRCIALGKRHVAEAPAVGEDMDRRIWQIALAQFQQAKKALAGEGRLATGEDDFAGITRYQRNQTLNLIEQPGVVSLFGGLRAHQAIMVALLGNHDRVHLRIGPVQHTHTVAGRHQADDVAFGQVFVVGGQYRVLDARLRSHKDFSKTFWHQVVGKTVGNIAAIEQECPPLAQHHRQGAAGHHLVQSHLPVEVDHVNVLHLSTKLQHRLAHPVRICLVSGSLRRRPTRCLKMPMLREQNPDSGLRPTTSLWIAWW
ncbi:hypothetical protein D3C78_652600 [compost metagenome]